MRPFRKNDPFPTREIRWSCSNRNGRAERLEMELTGWQAAVGVRIFF
ncbi:MAG: hypothetical protein MPW15_15700 [Candidatus Manganitrophus sp.]|nr:hypothetical protein [Candidatus Manganitrophus sp.]